MPTKNPARGMDYRPPTPESLKPKDLVGVPWRIAFALQGDGWFLRSYIIWYKPNCQPESVKDRPTRSHEYLFLFSKSEEYFYNREAILEPATSRKGTRNRRTVWTINTEPFADAHFATFPPTLIEVPILAGTEPDDLVLDPFFGSGTVGEVCLKLKRRFVGIELKADYAEIAAKRLKWQKAEVKGNGHRVNGVSRPEAERQIEFYVRLQAVRERYLSEALKKTVDDSSFDLEALNAELSVYADSKHLKRLASFGLRGEVCFPVPYLFRRNPHLLGYYRLLYNFSCKAFYDQGPFKRFQTLENEGIIRHNLEALIPAFCGSLAKTGEMLLKAVNPVSLFVVNDLQVLTLGAQLRGSGNVKLGQNAIDSFLRFNEGSPRRIQS
jgi:hypothetical protein